MHLAYLLMMSKLLLTRETRLSAAAFALMFGLSACGGGGGGSSPEAPPSNPTPPLNPPVLDASPYTAATLDLGSALAQSGFSAIHWSGYPIGPGWTAALGDANVTVTLSLDPAADVRQLPSLLNLTIGASGMQGGVLGDTSFNIPTSQLAMTARSHTVAGKALRRLTSGVQPSGVNLCVALIDAQNEGITYTKGAYWRYKYDGSTGMITGTNTAQGAGVLGVPTSQAAVEAMASSTYTGVVAGIVKASTDTVTYGFDELSALVQVSYDRAAASATVSLSAFQYFQSDCLTGGINPRQILSIGIPALEGFSCTGPVDVTNNTFRCTRTTDDGDLQWELRGRFFGPGGAEFSGSLSLRGAISVSSRTEGVAAAFLSKRVLP